MLHFSRTRTATVILILASSLTGCVTGKAILIDPRVSITARSDTVTATDSRRVTVPPSVSGQVESKRFVGQTMMLTNALHNGSVADLVGSVVAVQWPNSHVDVSEFTLSVEYGLWMATANAHITAEITPPEKLPFVVRASGSNLYYTPTPENFELAVERALSDFAEKLKRGAVELKSALPKKPHFD